jgi:protocatechuate 3,4-dioxygenase alpha subunit
MKVPATASQTAGPYVHLGLTEQDSVACLAGKDAQGERIRIRCSILDGDGQPVRDAVIELWQANSSGKYRHPEDLQDKPTDSAFLGFGRLAVGEDGTCTFETIKPGCVAGPGTSLQAPHINVSIFARGLLKQLVTRIYFAGDPNNDKDPVLEIVPEARRHTLLAQPTPSRPTHWEFAIQLCSENETVFFDV